MARNDVAPDDQERQPEEHRCQDGGHDRIVSAAFRGSGGLKAGPSEIASVPVITAEPTANARSSRTGVSAAVGGGIFVRWARRLPGEVQVQARSDQREHGHQEHVGRDGENAARLAHAAQIGQRDESDGSHAQPHPQRRQHLHRRHQLIDRRRDRHRHRQDVAHRQRRGGDQAGDLAQIAMGHDVAAAARGVGVDRLAITEDHRRQQHHDGDRNRERPHQRRDAGRQQDEQDFLRHVGHRRQRVRREDGQRLLLGQALVHLQLAVDRCADQQPPRPTPRAARFFDGQAGLEAARATAREAGVLRPGDANDRVARPETPNGLDYPPVRRPIPSQRGRVARLR